MDKMILSLDIPTCVDEVEVMVQHGKDIQFYDKHYYEDNRCVYLILLKNNKAFYYYFKSNGEFDYFKFSNTCKYYMEDFDLEHRFENIIDLLGEER